MAGTYLYKVLYANGSVDILLHIYCTLDPLRHLCMDTDRTYDYTFSPMIQSDDSHRLKINNQLFFFSIKLTDFKINKKLYIKIGLNIYRHVLLVYTYAYRYRISIRLGVRFFIKKKYRVYVFFLSYGCVFLNKQYVFLKWNERIIINIQKAYIYVNFNPILYKLKSQFSYSKLTIYSDAIRLKEEKFILFWIAKNFVCSLI